MAQQGPPEPTYFLDENAESYEVTRLLGVAGLNCVRMSDAGPGFCKSMKDTEWIPMVAARGWWGVTLDGRILKNSAERAVLLSTTAVHIYIKAQNAPSLPTAEALIVACRDHQLKEKIMARDRPTIVRVQLNGTFKFDDDRSPPTPRRPRRPPT